MLVEREGLLADLASDLDAALAGDGRIVLVGGEAGAGKTSLARAFAESARTRSRVRVGSADNVTTAGALAAFTDAVPEVVSALDDAGGALQRHTALRRALCAEPTALILEDLHWADEATVDALRYLARRLSDTSLMIVVTFRDDEVPANAPLTQLLGDTATAENRRRIQVPPLTVEGIGDLATHSGVMADASALHLRTGGNAFFVSELLASGAETVPASVSDAIVARYSALTPAAQTAAAAASVLGTTADAATIADVAASDLAAVDACVDKGLLVPTAEGIAFRHELARLAVERHLSALHARRLHGRALRLLLRDSPEDHRRIAHHAAGAGERGLAAEHALLSGHRAAALGAHREAATQYRSALRHGISGAPRADAFVRLSYECYLTDQIKEAVTARQHALEAHELAETSPRAERISDGSPACRGSSGAAATPSATRRRRSRPSSRSATAPRSPWPTAICHSSGCSRWTWTTPDAGASAH